MRRVKSLCAYISVCVCTTVAINWHSEAGSLDRNDRIARWREGSTLISANGFLMFAMVNQKRERKSKKIETRRKKVQRKKFNCYIEGQLCVSRDCTAS